MKYVYLLIWDIFVIGGCSYIVFWKGFSGWWFVLAVLMACAGNKK